MSLFEAITKEEFESSGTSPLEGKPADRASVKNGRESVVPETTGVGVFDNTVDTGRSTITYPCNYCGHCETPDDCAWSHTCPKCGAPAGKIGFQTYCKTPTGGLTGLHAERWL